MIFGEWFDEDVLDLEENPDFIELASTRVNNCCLWKSPWDNGFHRQVTGYSEVAKYLFDMFKESKDKELFYPIVFLMRNAIEIGLKRLLHMNMVEKVDEKIIFGKRYSHKIYKDLWNSIKPVLLHYSNEDYQNVSMLDLVESYIVVLDELDKQGDRFRYPGTYSHEYMFNNIEVDVENFFKYLLALFHSIGGFDSWLDHIREMEIEMRSNMDSYGYDY